MVREIKFRVIYKGKIVGYERLTDDGWQWMYLELNPDNGERWVKGVISQTEGFKRDEFTGLKDKNGKEIYEGDVFQKEDNEDYYGFVEWHKDSWHICYGKNERDPFGDYHMNGFEVIGNIYESPELIQQRL